MNITSKLKKLGASAAIATTLMTGIGAAATPASAYTGVIGGCTYNCGGFVTNSPAQFRGVTTRSDLGVIGIDMFQGRNGPVKVETWVWSYSAARYVVSGATVWVGDYNSSNGVISSPYTGIVQVRPGTRGAHSIYVRMSYGNGSVIYNGWVPQVSNMRYSYNTWYSTTSPYAYL